MMPFNPHLPTALFVGRWQPFHGGHRRLIATGLDNVGQAVIAIRDCGLSAENPLDPAQVASRITAGLGQDADRCRIIVIPNITKIYYGRNVGYDLERIDLDAATEAISATAIRAKGRERNAALKILVMGLPGAGKTTFSLALQKLLFPSIHLNADVVRRDLWPDLGFLPGDRLTQARRMGSLAWIAAQSNVTAIADFVCPTPACREEFSADFTVYCDRISISRFADTNTLFVKPESYNLRVDPVGTPEEWAGRAAAMITARRAANVMCFK